MTLLDDILDANAAKERATPAAECRRGKRARDPNGRYTQVKAAVRPHEKQLFYEKLPVLEGKSLSDIVRDHLIELGVKHGILPSDYK